MNIKVAAFTVSKVKYYKLYRRLELQETFPDVFFFFFFAGALRVIALMVTIMRGSRGGGGRGSGPPWKITKL